MRPFWQDRNRLCAFAVAISLASCASSPEIYLDKGNRLFDAGKYEDACIEYRQAIAKRSEFAEAYHRLGMCEFALGHIDSAASSLAEAANLVPEDRKTLEDNADVVFNRYLTSGRPAVLRTKVSAIITDILKQFPDSAAALRLNASLLFEAGRLQEAISAYKRANATEPFDPATVLSLVEALRLDNRQAEAEKEALRFIERNTEFVPIYDWLVQVYLSEKKPAEAEHILETRMNQRPHDMNAALTLAVFYRNVHRDREGNAIVESIVSRGSEFPLRYTAAGEFYEASRDWQAAERVFRAGIVSYPKERETFLRKISFLYSEQGRYGDSLNILDAVVREWPEDWDAQGARIENLIATNKIDEAITMASEVIKRHSADGRFHALAGKAYGLKGDVRKAEQYYAEASRLNSRFTEPRIALAEISKARRDVVGVTRYSEEALAVDWHDLRPRLLHAWSLIYRSDFLRAENEMTALARDYPQSFEVRMQSGLLYIAERRASSAIAVFERLLEAHPGDAQALAGLATAYLQKGAYDAASSLVERELKRSPLPEGTRILLANLAERLGKAQIALEQYKTLAAARPQAPEYRFELGKLYEALGDGASAVVAFEEAARLDPDSSVKQGRLALAYYAAGKDLQADLAYLKSITLDPHDAMLLNNRAYFLAETGRNPDEAVRLAQAALQTNPSDPAFRDTLALSYIGKHSSDSAIQILRSLIGSYQSDPVLRYHLAKALLQKGDREAARIELETGLSKHPSKEDRVKIQALLASVRT